MDRLKVETVITFGTFDVFHVGHLHLLERAAAYGSRLVVGVSTDQLNIEKKGRPPVYPQDERKCIVSALRCVDEVFFEESMDLKNTYIEQFGADVLVMGDDWKGQFDYLSHLSQIIYLPRTPAISTTEVIEKIRH